MHALLAHSNSLHYSGGKNTTLALFLGREKRREKKRGKREGGFERCVVLFCFPEELIRGLKDYYGSTPFE